jgi:aryl-alcohol dehydrogenase-like predicted oxidoreductase
MLNGLKKIEKLRFLEGPDRSLGQAALLWLLADDRVASTLPNIYNEKQLAQFAAAPDAPALSDDELARVAELARENFGVEEEPPKYKGLMEAPAQAVPA